MLSRPYKSLVARCLSIAVASDRSLVRRGFTIVELLVVIVVIAVLATITIISYQGIQQRTNNAAIIDAAAKSLRMIQAYIGAYDKYPQLSGSSCITNASGCQVNNNIMNTSATFDNAIATVGTLPRTIPMDSGTNQSGVWYNHSPTRTYNGAVQPALLIYWLYGTSQQCVINDVVSGWTIGTSSSVGYSYANDNGKTLCYIHIPGPTS